MEAKDYLKAIEMISRQIKIVSGELAELQGAFAAEIIKEAKKENFVMSEEFLQ